MGILRQSNFFTMALTAVPFSASVPQESSRTKDPRSDVSNVSQAKQNDGRHDCSHDCATDGSVTDIHLVGSSARSLDDATMQTLKGWKFKPAMCGTEPVVSDIHVVVSFRLN